MTNFIKTKGVVLRRTNFAEYDRIVQFLTPNGQVSVLAKGVRKPKSKLAGGLELFSVSDLVMIKGKTDLYRLTSARLEHYFDNIIKNYESMELAYQIIADIARASRDIDDGGWFEILYQVLMGLDRGFDLGLVRAWYYFQAQEMSGEAINLSFDVSGNKLLAERKYRYNPTERAFEIDDNGGFNKNHIKLMRLMSQHQLLVVNQVERVEEYLTQIEKVIEN